MLKSTFLFPGYLTKVQKISLAGAIAFSIVSFILLVQYKVVDVNSQIKSIAVLTKQSQVVTRKNINSLSFIDIETGDNVFNGDQIFTGTKSDAVVVFLKSKNIINIPSKSLVRIELDEDGDVVEIKDGFADFIIQKNQEISIIKGKNKISLISGINSAGEATVSDDDNKLVIKVKSGDITFIDKISGAKEKISLSESISLDKGVVKKMQGFQVLSPLPGERIDILSPVEIRLDKTIPISVFLSQNSDFSDNVHTEEVDSYPFQLRAKIKAGDYYLKLVAKSGFETILPINFYSPFELTGFQPVSGATVNLKKAGPLTLSWDSTKAPKYKVVVKDSLGKVAEYITPVPEIKLEDVKGRSLSWSASPMSIDGEFHPQSKQNKIILNFIGANKLISPAGEGQFTLGEVPIQFRWDSLLKETFRVIIRNNQTSVNIVDKFVSTDLLDFTPENIGSMTFILESRDYPGLTKVEYPFEVKSIVATWNPKDPVEYAEVDEEKKIEFNFESKLKDIKNLELRVASSQSFDQDTQVIKIQSKKVVFNMKKFGNYCFKINPITPDSFLQDSEIKCVVFKRSEAFGPALEAKNIVMTSIQINGVDGYTVEVSKNEKASLFEFQVFKDADGKELVFTTRSKNNVMTWISSRSGVYYYRYRVFDEKNRSSNYSTIGKLIFPISPFSDWKK